MVSHEFVRGFATAKSSSFRIDRASDRRESASNKKSNCARWTFINIIHRVVIRRKSWTFFAGKGLTMDSNIVFYNQISDNDLKCYFI